MGTSCRDQYRLSHVAATTTKVQRVMLDGGPAAGEPAEHLPVCIWSNGDASLRLVDECEELGTSVDKEGLAQNAKIVKLKTASTQISEQKTP